MTDRLYNFVLHKEHHKYRTHAEISIDHSASPIERMTSRFEQMCALQTPVILPNEQIVLIRTTENLPDIMTEQEWAEIEKTHFRHELGYMSNLSPDYGRIISTGLSECAKTADEYGKREIAAIVSLCKRYRDFARKNGRDDVADILGNVPEKPAKSFREALQFFRIIHFALWLEGNYHVTVGRFDKYMYPYFKADIDSGALTKTDAFELLCDFFLSFNKDSDMYPGVQQGDNGQSLVLGGTDENGNEVFSELSAMCLEASGRLLMIDPKINLRVNSKTPDEVYIRASTLTKAGLGFPQYSNDDVVIPALEKMGYDKKDAANYVVAACWEFIIPGVGADIANIAALSFPKVIDVCLHRDLEKCKDFDEFLSCVKKQIHDECENICGSIKKPWFVPSPFMNVCMDVNIYEGGKYNNYGIHGTGISTAADSLSAIKKYVFDEKSISAKELISAVDGDFKNTPELLAKLRYETPKMGSDDNTADGFGTMLLDEFSASLSGKKNSRGGIYRAGTGSAMFYLWHADEIGASPDGRRKGEPFAANFSPSLFAKTSGPFGIIKSFSKQHFINAANGGPLTLEFHSSMFDGDDGIKKVAMLVKAYMALGGEQLQLNAVNLETLKDAKIHPENHRQLVVRIWGWSAYFVELDERYQNHVMKRCEYKL